MPNKNVRNAKDHFLRSLNLLVAAANIGHKINTRSTDPFSLHGSSYTKSDDSVMHKAYQECTEQDVDDFEVVAANVSSEPLIDGTFSNTSTLRKRSTQQVNFQDDGDTIEDMQVIKISGKIIENKNKSNDESCNCS